MNIYVVIVVLLTEIIVLDQTLMRKQASKLDDVIKNCHESFLIMIDFILTNTTDENVQKSIDYVLLHKVIDKKLQELPANKKDNGACVNQLTTFRQKNELNRALLKRVVCELEDYQPAKKNTSLKELCQIILETLRMTVDETAMDITKSQENFTKVVDKLDKIYTLTEQVTQKMKKLPNNNQYQKSTKTAAVG